MRKPCKMCQTLVGCEYNSGDGKHHFTTQLGEDKICTCGCHRRIHK